MSYVLYADVFADGELYNTDKSCHVKSLTNQVITRVVIPLNVSGEPVIKDLRLRIYGNDENGNGPLQLIRTSTNKYQKTDIISAGKFGFNHMPFFFEPYAVTTGQEFHLVLNADIYTPSGDAVLSWQNCWPDPVYTTNYVATGNNYLTSPPRVVINGDTF